MSQSPSTDALYRDHGDYLWGLAFRMLGVRADAEEVVNLTHVLARFRDVPALADGLGEAGRRLIADDGYLWADAARTYEETLVEVVRTSSVC